MAMVTRKQVGIAVIVGTFGLQEVVADERSLHTHAEYELAPIVVPQVTQVTTSGMLSGVSMSTTVGVGNLTSLG
jgi:hypothetical protein